jgi:hypothetical protein
VTVVTPTLKQVPDVFDAEIVGVPQLSVTVGAVHDAFAQESAVLRTIFAGQFRITGFVTSDKHGFVTVTLKEHVPTLLFASFAV